MKSESIGQLVINRAAQQKISDYEWLMADFRIAAVLIDRKDLFNWGTSTAGFFLSGVGSRAGNIAQLMGTVGSGAWALMIDGYKESRRDNLWAWTKLGVSDVAQRAQETMSEGYERSTRMIAAIKENPAQAAPELATMVLTTFLVSGGVDGNGGAPDLDLVMGIGAHRSLFTHSILMGATIETAVRSVLRFVQLVHARLPQDRHPWWNSAFAFSNQIGDAAVTGANYGMAYHLFVDGIVQPGAYHGLPFSMPMEAHQALVTANAVAESMEPTRRNSEIAVANGSDHAVHWKAQHKTLLSTPFKITPMIEVMLDPEHAFAVRRYGTWFQALEAGMLEPRTAAQEQFIACARGTRAPETLHEIAWFGYKLVKRLDT